MSEARNLRNMTQAQTPLLGQENTPLHALADGGTGFEGATPRHSVGFTPNPLATPLRRGGDFDPSATPRSEAGSVSIAGATPLRTPMRDNLSINLDDGASSVSDTPRDQRLRASAAKRALQLGFSSLPKPTNDFEVMLPDEEEGPDGDDQILSEEDAAERDARIQRRKEEEARRVLARRSTVVRLGLPRPVSVDVQDLLRRLAAVDVEDEISRLVDYEFVQLLEHDAIAHPLPGTSLPGGTISRYEHPDDDAFAEAKEAVHRELAQSLGFPDANEDQIKRGLVVLAAEEDVDTTSLGWATTRKGLAFDAVTKTWVEPATLSPEARIAGISALLDEEREAMTKNAAKAAKMEKKLGVTLGGYQARSKVLTKRITDAFDNLRKTHVDFVSFSRLSINEAAAGPRRVASLQEEVERLEIRERMLQGRYQELDEDRRDIRARLAAKEERLMEEAEAANEAALAALDAAEAGDVVMEATTGEEVVVEAS